MPDTSKLFFALWPDDKTKQALESMRQSIERIIAIKELKWVQPHNFHVTLAFLGHVDANAEALIKQRVADIVVQPFALTFNSLSYWSKPRILCLTSLQPAQEVVMLAAHLQSAAANCGLQTDCRPYIPHVTLSRHVRYLPKAMIKPIVWHAEGFCLAESCSGPNGVLYKVIQRWPLRADN